MKSTKLCECGCGQFTDIIEKNHSDHGHIKGQPYRFLFGHRKTIMDQTEHFWSKVNKKGPMHFVLGTNCWVWTGPFFKKKGAKDYGSSFFERKNHQAHRVAWFLTYGKWPENFACHRCDNKSCVRPSHLFDGTTDENMEDMRIKGRAAVGEKNGASKLTEKEVLDILSLTSSRTHKEVAKKYQVSKSAIDSIVQGRSWGYLSQ